VPIKLVLPINHPRGRKDLTCPEVHCDYCQERIKSARHGNYEWEVDEQGAPTTGQMCFTHKLCSRPFRQANGEAEGRHWFSMELADLLVFLPRNLSTSPQQVAAHERKMIEHAL